LELAASKNCILSLDGTMEAKFSRTTMNRGVCPSQKLALFDFSFSLESVTPVNSNVTANDDSHSQVPRSNVSSIQNGSCVVRALGRHNAQRGRACESIEYLLSPIVGNFRVPPSAIDFSP